MSYYEIHFIGHLPVINKLGTGSTAQTSQSGNDDSLLHSNEITYIRLGENGQLQTESFTQVTNQDGTSTLVKRASNVDGSATKDISDRDNSHSISNEETPTDDVNKNIFVDVTGNLRDSLQRTSFMISSGKDLKKSDVESIITLLNREKEYVQTLQRLIQTALGEKKDLDGETKIMLDQLSDFMRPKEIISTSGSGAVAVGEPVSDEDSSSSQAMTQDPTLTTSDGVSSSVIMEHKTDLKDEGGGEPHDPNFSHSPETASSSSTTTNKVDPSARSCDEL